MSNLTYFESKVGVVKDHPVLCATILIAGVLLGIWYCNGQIAALREKSAAISERQKLTEDKLALAMDEAGRTYEEFLKRANLSVGENLSWIEPICVHIDDTIETKKQTLAFHLTARELGLDKFQDKDYCKGKYPNSGP